MSAVRDQLAHVVRLLVDEPDRLEVEEIEELDEVVFRLRVAESDLGKVIGRQGRTARALRTVVDARGDKDDVDYLVDIED